FFRLINAFFLCIIGSIVGIIQFGASFVVGVSFAASWSFFVLFAVGVVLFVVGVVLFI
ncbi:hypothetical protein C2G38_2063409, partial [Gigaspora rosea]